MNMHFKNFKDAKRNFWLKALALIVLGAGFSAVSFYAFTIGSLGLVVASMSLFVCLVIVFMLKLPNFFSSKPQTVERDPQTVRQLQVPINYDEDNNVYELDSSMRTSYPISSNDVSSSDDVLNDDFSSHYLAEIQLDGAFQPLVVLSNILHQEAEEQTSLLRSYNDVEIIDYNNLYDAIKPPEQGNDEDEDEDNDEDEAVKELRTVFTCPISYELIKEPMTLQVNDHYYFCEKKELKKWWETSHSKTNPFTNLALLKQDAVIDGIPKGALDQIKRTTGNEAYGLLESKLQKRAVMA